MTHFILALCGLPSSGKSALADAIRDGLNSDIEIVRTDDWRNQEYYRNWNPEKEGPVREAALEKVREFVIQGRSVIHDDTNYYTSMRHDLFKIALDNRCAFAVIHVSTPLDVALKWNNERSNTRIPDSVIQRINERFDLPGRRYLWDDAMIEVDMANQSIDEVVPEIAAGIQGLEAAMEPEPRMAANTEFERLDVETRRTVTEFLEAHPSLRGRREVSEIRRSVLSHAIQRGIPVESVRGLLLEKLDKLL
jgi:O-phosphoseryl-tRNA(Sec) kinase